MNVANEYYSGNIPLPSTNILKRMEFISSTSNAHGARPDGNNQFLSIVTLTDRQQRILSAAKEWEKDKTSNKFSIVDIIKRRSIPYFALQQAWKREISMEAILPASEGRVSPQRLSAEEEQIIFDCPIGYQQNETLLDRKCICD